ncbi:MAG: hypothetical protein J3R72DRAFT_527552 [Linnemannia gamsii]|nr:MAG: hypothetical protein J3R72DRAFT_527552 [Linnemannia gamsii]
MNHFFDIAELVHHLIQFLDYKGISRLMQTSRHLNALFTPAHYYNVHIDHAIRKRQLFSSPESTQALVRNIHHVRQLCFGAREVVFYVNGVFAYQDRLLQQMTNAAAKDDLLPQQPYFQPQRPLWLAPPDPPIPILIPIPPMTMLTKLNIVIDYSGDYLKCRYHLPSFHDPKATFTYICWILDSNPHLLDVSIDRLVIKDQRDVRLLTTSIFGLKNLQRLTLMPSIGIIWEMPSDLAMSFFFCCPPSLQSFEFGLIVEEGYWNFDAVQRFVNSIQGQLQPWEKDEAVCEIPATIPQRLGPLTNLRILEVSDDRHHSVSESHIRSMLAHCPNLTDLAISGLWAVRNEQDLAQDIAQLCPKVSSIKGLDDCRVATPDLIGQLLRTLPQQQVKKIYCPNQDFFADQGLGYAERLFRRHSTTLRSVTLSGCKIISSKTIQVILVECEALEDFTVYQDFENRERLCICLEDAIEFPWACARIRTLGLTVAVPDEPFHYLAENTVPYYSRPAPTELTVAEKKQLRSLEALYRQIGTLTGLQELDLRAIFFDPQNHRPTSGLHHLNTLPGMLSLGCEETGRPGYLDHFSGLTKLKRLWGSVSVGTNETLKTIGMDEVAWMERHWPALESATFCVKEAHKIIPEAFLWWKEQRAGKKFYIGV